MVLKSLKTLSEAFSIIFFFHIKGEERGGEKIDNNFMDVISPFLIGTSA